MRDRPTDTVMGREVPGWFMPAAIAALLWELLGFAMFLFEMSLDATKLPLDQRAIVEAMPRWVYLMFAVACGTGIAGAIQLIRRRKGADVLLLISLIATILTQASPLIVPKLRDLMTSDAMFMPFVIVVICYAVWHLARMAARRGWLYR